jgi:hypothetical protein
VRSTATLVNADEGNPDDMEDWSNQEDGVPSWIITLTIL